MAKLRLDSIALADFEEYLSEYSDFSFELRVLRALRDSGLICEHGGLYEDPVTKKSRGFDVRATRSIDKYRIRLALECKNVRVNFPVLIACIPRQTEESYHEIALVSEPRGEAYEHAAFKSRAAVIRLSSEHSIYRPNDPVGKSIAQVGRAADGTVIANNTEIHEKWAQCLASANDLMDRMYYEGSDASSATTLFAAVLPFLVVPDGTLWFVTYDENGDRVRGPEKADRCSYFIDKEYSMGSNVAGANYALSHLEIVTLAGLRSFVADHMDSVDAVQRLFPLSGINEAFRRSRLR